MDSSDVASRNVRLILRLEVRGAVRKRIDFDFFIYADGEDGFSFNVNANATRACITLPTGGPIYLGQGAAVYQSPLNLLNPGALCQ